MMPTSESGPWVTFRSVPFQRTMNGLALDLGDLDPRGGGVVVGDDVDPAADDPHLERSHLLAVPADVEDPRALDGPLLRA